MLTGLPSHHAMSRWDYCLLACFIPLLFSSLIFCSQRGKWEPHVLFKANCSSAFALCPTTFASLIKNTNLLLWACQILTQALSPPMLNYIILYLCPSLSGPLICSELLPYLTCLILSYPLIHTELHIFNPTSWKSSTFSLGQQLPVFLIFP